MLSSIPNEATPVILLSHNPDIFRSVPSRVTLTLAGHTLPGLMSTRTCTLFWPWGRVQNRLVDGDENNVLHYYQALLEGPANEVRH